MEHTRKEVIARTIQEYDHLDRLVANLTDEEWNRPVPRPESKDPWTVKDALAHITHWKAGVARSARGQHKPPEEKGLTVSQENHGVFLEWRDRSPREVLAWHRQVQKEVLTALQEAPEAWYKSKSRWPDWPGDLTGHSAFHRTKDIEQALEKGGSV